MPAGALIRSAPDIAMRIAARRGPLTAPAGMYLRSRGLRSLATDPSVAVGTPTSRRINQVLEWTGGQRYLEIGLKFGSTLEAVRAARRVGVEPAPRFNPWPSPKGLRVHVTTSDAFFAQRSGERPPLDFVFLDGLHEFGQTYRDLMHAVALMVSGGFILLDDVVPSSAAAAAPTRAEAKRLREPDDPSREWMGDVFRIMSVLDEAHPELEFRTIVDADHRPQALIKVAAPKSTNPAPKSTIDRAARLAFGEVFAGGMPPSFRPASLDSALHELAPR